MKRSFMVWLQPEQAGKSNQNTTNSLDLPLFAETPLVGLSNLEISKNCDREALCVSPGPGNVNGTAISGCS